MDVVKAGPGEFNERVWNKIQEYGDPSAVIIMLDVTFGASTQVISGCFQIDGDILTSVQSGSYYVSDGGSVKPASKVDIVG